MPDSPSSQPQPQAAPNSTPSAQPPGSSASQPRPQSQAAASPASQPQPQAAANPTPPAQAPGSPASQPQSQAAANPAPPAQPQPQDAVPDSRASQSEPEPQAPDSPASQPQAAANPAPPAQPPASTALQPPASPALRPLACFADLLAHLDARGLFHMDFGLGRMRAALKALGLAGAGSTPETLPGPSAGASAGLAAGAMAGITPGAAPALAPKAARAASGAPVCRPAGASPGAPLGAPSAPPSGALLGGPAGTGSGTGSGAGALARPVAVQVVGTNGKGSVSLMLAEIMRAHGLRAGLYASPHFVDVRERALVDGRKLDEAAWTTLGSAVLATPGGPELTYFECVTAIAALGFARAGCDAVVLEAGLGGAHDATTALDADLTVFTAMGLDHMAVLGPTLAHIARDKAGAMRPGVPAVSGPQPPEAMAMLRARAREIGAPFMTVEDVLGVGVPAAAPGAGASGPSAVVPAPAMAGEHQHENAALALAAWTLLARARGWASDPAACARAVGAARLPGRLQRVPGGPGRAELWLDGAHNVPALERLARAVGRDVPRPAAVIFACMADKDFAAMAPLVAGLTDGPLWLPALPEVPRALAPEAAAALLGPRAVPLPGLARALELADGLGGGSGAPGPVLVCGSLYLLGALYALRPECLGTRGPDLALPPAPDA